MALCVTHNISFDPQWEWCIYCGKPAVDNIAQGSSTGDSPVKVTTITSDTHIDINSQNVHDC